MQVAQWKKTLATISNGGRVTWPEFVDFLRVHRVIAEACTCGTYCALGVCVGRVGGYGVYFGDHKDAVEFLPVDEPQTNIRGELRAALRALQGHILGTRSLICPDCQLVVDGVLGLAQRWRRHKWRNTTGEVAHADLCTQILELIDRYGTEIKWMHIPSHVGIRGNEKADQLADLGRRKSPLLFGRISVSPRPEEEEEERELLEGEASF